jgi:hypothetical protein
MTQRSPAGAPGICRLSCAVGQSISGWLESPGRPYDVLGSLPWPEFTCRQFEFKLPNSVGSIGWNSSNGGLEAVDSSIEEDLNHSIVVTTTIRAATAIVIRIMAAPLFGRDCAWCVKGSVEVIGCSPVADMRTKLNGRRYGAISTSGKRVAIVKKTRRRMGESGARRRRFSKKNPPLATGRSLGRNGKVSRFAAGLCVVIHTRRGKLCP